MSKTISRALFKKEVIRSSHLALVHFRTEWNGACHIISPFYEDLARNYEGIASFFSMDIEQEAGVREEFGITECPTILFFKNGEMIDHAVGLIPKDLLVHKIEKALTNVRP